ncbi:hypothetical protein N7535_002651 [Penicillium sp. DV-2018c]|nr:hypothetical protein N7535_002651 [Penicillium sp. DV-2018c]
MLQVLSNRHQGYRQPDRIEPAKLEIRQYFDGKLQAHDALEAWQAKPEVPSSEELMGNTESEDSALIPNRIEGVWDSKDEYLKTHYALLREDAVSPLRAAVAKLRADPWMMDTQDIAVYEKVFITGITAARSGLALHIQFSTRRAGKNIAWSYSKRLTPGALIALTPKEDAFSTKCVPGVVACRLAENIEKDPPEVDIFLASPEDMEIDPQQEWLMVEHRVGYYEATRHTMTALQKLSKERFPLSEHICQVMKNIGPPEYRKAEPVMDFKVLSQDPGLNVSKCNVLEQWPLEPIGKLETSQWSALNQMLAKRLAIIQGPPGTGKTFTSLVALQMILANSRPQDPPIIIAAQTNHALDQLIRQIAVFESKYVRLGGRTTDPEIRKHTTYYIRQEQTTAAKLTIKGGLFSPSKTRQDKITVEIKKLLGIISPENSERPIGISMFLQHNLLSQEQADSLQRNIGTWQQTSVMLNADPIAAWVADSLKEFSYQYSGDFGFAEDDIDREYEQLKELEAELGYFEEGSSSTFMSQFIAFGRGLCNANRSRVSDSLVKKQLEQRDLWNIHKRYRGPVYDYLRQQLLVKLREELRRLAKDYEDATRNYQIGRMERDYCFLEEARIIGVTATGLSKYRGLISALSPRIILIEEAAEVLEAPITVACLPSLEHLILVGDHQQLKGHCANHTLAGYPFYLDMSMFERLVRNQMPYVMLQEQRRMIPEIRRLLTPIYGEFLHDHPCVEKLPDVPGMGGIRSFFYSHAEPESNDSLLSKVNDFEASMVIKFLAYLVTNGVPPEKITVLTFYNGQKKLLMRKKVQDDKVALLPVNILTVDTYQGEENDIVILSLVRSNEHRGIGFIAQENRVCVALSRAKYGFYIFGNSRCVEAKSGLLAEVVKLMADDKPYRRIGRGIPLHCIRHDKKTTVRYLEDWGRITNGCERPCGKALACGHMCPRQCHADGHDWLSCNHPCTVKNPCCGMTCSSMCSPPHEHVCLCPVGQYKKLKFHVNEGNDSSNPMAATPPTGSPATRGMPAVIATRAGKKATKLLTGRAATPGINKTANTPTRHAAVRVTPQGLAGLQHWKNFAQGGALVDDYHRAGFVLRNGHFERHRTTAPVQWGVGARVAAPIQVDNLIDLDEEEDGDQQPIAQNNERCISGLTSGRGIVDIHQDLMDLGHGGFQVESLTGESQVLAVVDGLSQKAKEEQVSSMSDNEKSSAAEEGKPSLAPAAKENVAPLLEGILIDLD